MSQFRNYEHLELKLHPGTNLFYGDNAQGKTNILEAVYLSGTTKSHRGAKDRDMIRFGQEEAHIRTGICKHEIAYRIDMHLKKNKAKGIAINGLPIRRAGELVGLCSFVFFSPEDLSIVKSGPAQRRRFMDLELCQLNAGYLHDLSAYQRILMQRARLLKDLAFRSDLMQTLDLWDEQLTDYGAKIIQEREGFITQLQELIRPIHRRITGGKEELTVRYEKNVSPASFHEALKRDLERDMRGKMTNSGPHRDDLLFEAGGVDLRRFGSQGQQRTCALSLKLAEIEMVRQVKKDLPVLMLDDVLSELDAGRQSYLLESIDGVQTLMTGTGIEGFEQRHFRIDQCFTVKEG